MQLVQDDQQIQIEAIANFLIISRVSTNVLFIIKVKIILHIK